MAKTCLVVDDSRVVRTFARRILEENGFEVSEAGDGNEALAMSRAAEVDVILLDWNMPSLDGMGFLKAFRAEFPGRGTVVIFCTTENDHGKIQQAIAHGAQEYIMKPFDAEILMSKLRQTGVAE